MQTRFLILSCFFLFCSCSKSQKTQEKVYVLSSSLRNFYSKGLLSEIYYSKKWNKVFNQGFWTKQSINYYVSSLTMFAFTFKKYCKFDFKSYLIKVLLIISKKHYCHKQSFLQQLNFGDKEVFELCVAEPVRKVWKSCLK